MLTKNMTKQLYVLFLCTFLIIQTISPMPPHELSMQPSLTNSMACFACACAGAAIFAFINLYFFNKPLAPLQKNTGKPSTKPIDPEKIAFNERLEARLAELEKEAIELRSNKKAQENTIESLGAISKGLLMISCSMVYHNQIYSQKQNQLITEIHNSLHKKNVLLPDFIATHWLHRYTQTKKTLATTNIALQKAQGALENNISQQ